MVRLGRTDQHVIGVAAEDVLDRRDVLTLSADSDEAFAEVGVDRQVELEVRSEVRTRSTVDAVLGVQRIEHVGAGPTLELVDVVLDDLPSAPHGVTPGPTADHVAAPLAV